jgi:hypothetical protein
LNPASYLITKLSPRSTHFEALMDTETSPSSIPELIRRYEDEVFFGDERAAAEYAFALAIRLRDAGQAREARLYAQRCLHYAERLPAKSLDDVASERQSIGGVPLPGMFHDGVVRSRLRDLLVD